MNRAGRSGLTLVEILIAMLVFAVGALGLAASSASLARQMSWNADRFRASTLATTRIEQIDAARCATSSGSDRSGSVTAAWTSITDNGHLRIDQTITRLDSRGKHTDVMRGASPCK